MKVQNILVFLKITQNEKINLKNNILENWNNPKNTLDGNILGFWSHLILYLSRALTLQKSVTIRSTVYGIFNVSDPTSYRHFLIHLPHQPNEFSIVVISLLQRKKKLKLEEIKKFAGAITY